MSDKEKLDLENIPRFSEVSKRIVGDFIKVAKLVDVPIIIWRFEVQDSIYRESDKDPNKQYMKIQFSYESKPQERLVTGTSSYYLIEDVEGIEDKLPVRATIVHRELPKKRIDEKIRYAYMLT